MKACPLFQLQNTRFSDEPILREHGAEAARSVLGHKQINMTLHYSGIDLERAKEVMTKIG